MAAKDVRPTTWLRQGASLTLYTMTSAAVQCKDAPTIGIKYFYLEHSHGPLLVCGSRLIPALHHAAMPAGLMRGNVLVRDHKTCAVPRPPPEMCDIRRKRLKT
jgi:hypothetical protein